MKAASAIFALWCAWPAPAHADCLPSADLSGDADVAAEVARALARLGVVFSEAEEACSAVHATVLADANGVAVTVRDARGRIEGRVVADAHTAAAWIESWASDDAAPLWEMTPVVREKVEVAAVEVAPPSTVDEVVVPAAPAKRRWRLPEVGVRLGRDFANDGSAWDGVGAAACLGVGKLCLGVAGRYARDSAFSDTGGLTAYDRTASAISATIAVRAAIARVVIAPELAIGVGATSTRRHEASEPCFEADGMVPCANMPIYIGDGFEATTYAPRIAAALGVQVPLATWLALDARLGAEAVPGAHTSRHVHNVEMTPPDPTTPIVPGDPLLDLPGEPLWAWTAAIGLIVEAP